MALTRGDRAALAWVEAMTLAPDDVTALRAAGHDPRVALRLVRRATRALYLATRLSGVRHAELLDEAREVEGHCYDRYGPDLGWSLYHEAVQGVPFANSAAG